ncbi:protein YAE1 homolog [Protopterus annectens]|uniref:protein YAE1 homolog n=1 Tax=Protopterus annectens TaxID=7888 RepID=UPI001CFB5EC7|nr:protein YAE1 homolog [Protopterus annectens]
MSWLKSVSHSGDDVFDEEADEMLVSQREWGSTMDKRVKVSNLSVSYCGRMYEQKSSFDYLHHLLRKISSCATKFKEFMNDFILERPKPRVMWERVMLNKEHGGLGVLDKERYMVQIVEREKASVNGQYAENNTVANIILYFLFIDSALQTWCQIHEQYREHLQKIQSLWDQVVHHEKHMLETVRVGHKPTHLGDLADSVEDMDIGEKSFRQHENRSRDGAGEMKEDCLKNPDIVSCKEQESICVRSSSSNMTTYTIEQLLQKTSHLVKELDLPVELTEYISHLEH